MAIRGTVISTINRLLLDSLESFCSISRELRKIQKRNIYQINVLNISVQMRLIPNLYYFYILSIDLKG